MANMLNLTNTHIGAESSLSDRWEDDWEQLLDLDVTLLLNSLLTLSLLWMLRYLSYKDSWPPLSIWDLYGILWILCNGHHHELYGICYIRDTVRLRCCEEGATWQVIVEGWPNFNIVTKHHQTSKTDWLSTKEVCATGTIFVLLSWC